MPNHLERVHPVHIPNVPMRCNPDVMGGYMVRIFKLELKCGGLLLGKDNVKKIGRYISNVIDLGLVVTYR